MKKYIPTTAILLFSTFAALGQGVVNFSMRVTGTVNAHVYGPDFHNPTTQFTGNAHSYTGVLLSGSGFSAQLFAGNGMDQPESALVLVPGSLTSFRTGATLGGTPAPLTLAVPGVPAGGTGTFQIRAWDNMNGTIASYDFAEIAGKSALFNVSGLGDGVLTLPADFANVQNFNIHTPEPTTTALLGLGALGLWLIRRKQRAA